MKKFLFTLAALMMMGTAYADDYLYIEDFEVTPEFLAGDDLFMDITVKAHFDTYTSAWQVWVNCPEGIVPIMGEALPDMTIKGFNRMGRPVDHIVALMQNADFPEKYIAASTEADYQDIDGTNTSVGAAKWAPGEYDMFTLWVEFSPEFTGGQIVVVTEPSVSGDDPRGECCPKGQHHEIPCNVTVAGGEPIQTPAPEIQVTRGDDAYIFEAIGEGEITLYLDGTTVVENPYTVARTEEDQVVKLTAVAHVEGQTDGSVTGEYMVPALEIVTPQDLTGEIVIGEVTEDGTVTINYNGDEDVTITVTVNGEEVEVVDGVITLGEGENEITVTVTAEGYNTLTETVTVVYEPTVEPEKTEAPTYEIVDDPEAQTVTIIATGNGHITILNDEMLVAEGDGEAVWVIPYGDDPEGEEFGFTVYAQEEGKEISDPVNGEVVVPGKTVEPVVTDMPEITYEVTDDAIIITATGEGEVLLYVDGALVDNPCTIERGTEDKVVVVTATAQAEGQEISEVATMEITIPAVEDVPEDPHMVGYWICLTDEANEEHWYVLNPDPNGEDNWSIMMTLHHQPWALDVPFYFMANGVRYGAETDMQVPEMGDADHTVLNPVFEGENCWSVPAGYTYTWGLQFKGEQIWLLVAQGPMTGVNELNGDKAIAGVRYFNMAGQEMKEANGMTIVVTTYTDGTTSAVKVME